MVLKSLGAKGPWPKAWSSWTLHSSPQQGEKVTSPKKSLCALEGERLTREESEHFSPTCKVGEFGMHLTGCPYRNSGNTELN